MQKILIIIPSYNESENIIKLIDALFAENLGVDILVVDDSSDNTADLVRDKQIGEDRLFLIKRSKKSGRGTAVLEGFEFGLSGKYEFIAEMDADFSHDPREFKSLVAVAEENALVIGSRYLKKSKVVGCSFVRRIFSRFANSYANIVLGIGIHDYTNGYRVYGRKALEKLDVNKIKGSGYMVLSEISYQLYKNGVKFIEVPTTFVNRKRGASNFSMKEVKEAFVSILRIRFS
ncbi:MAG: polyprenol monophosphomannose synthase [Patescibacteria group bacterium]